MSLTVAAKAFFSLGHKQPLLLFSLGTVLSLAGGAVACVYFGSRSQGSGLVTLGVFAMFALATLGMFSMALPCLRGPSAEPPE